MYNSFRAWFSALRPREQVFHGCWISIAGATILLYLLGFASVLLRPLLLTENASRVQAPLTTPTRANLVNATQPPPAGQDTPAPVVTLALPQMTLGATPTQAPLPTRALDTATPTPTGAASATPAPSPIGVTATPSRTPVLPTVTATTALPSATPVLATATATRARTATPTLTPVTPSRTPTHTRTPTPTATPTALPTTGSINATATPTGTRRIGSGPN